MTPRCSLAPPPSKGAGNDYQKDLQFRKLNAVKDIIEIKVVRGGEVKVRRTAGRGEGGHAIMGVLGRKGWGVAWWMNAVGGCVQLVAERGERGRASSCCLTGAVGV